MRRPTKNSITLRRVGAFGVAGVLMNMMVPVGVRAAEHNSLLWFINDDSQTSNAIRRLVEAPASQTDAAGIPARVAAFYRGRDFSPAWSGGERAEARAEAVMGVLQRAAEQGLHSTS